MSASEPCPHCAPAGPGCDHNQPINDMCFVCGYENPTGLHAQFVEDGTPGQVTGVFTARDIHCSYPGRLHGGVIAAICDESIGRAYISGNHDHWGVTMELTVRYHKPTPLNVPLTVKASITKETRRTFEGQCDLFTQEGLRCVSASAIYAKLPVERIVAECASDDSYVWVPDTRSIPTSELDAPEHR